MFTKRDSTKCYIIDKSRMSSNIVVYSTFSYIRSYIGGIIKFINDK